MYKYELHCHTGDVSRCGRVPADEIVRLYKEKGYSGIVITDHYSPMTFPLKNQFSPEKAMDLYLSGYKKAQKAAGEGFTVLLGMELRFYCTVNDYLLYGVTEEFLRSCGNLLGLYPEKASRLAHENGMIFFQAHPYRAFITRANPALLDGTEAYNSKDTPQNMARVCEWAAKNELKYMISGSDFHTVKQLARGGIATEKPILSNDDLLTVIKSGEYKLIKDGIICERE